MQQGVRKKESTRRHIIRQTGKAGNPPELTDTEKIVVDLLGDDVIDGVKGGLIQQSEYYNNQGRSFIITAKQLKIIKLRSYSFGYSLRSCKLLKLWVFILSQTNNIYLK